MKSSWEVMKFGGSSVAAARHWPTILKLCQNKISMGNNVLVVLSALKNVSNTLEALVHQALAGVHQNAIQRIKDYHCGFASELSLDGGELLANLFDELISVCEQINQQQTISPENYAKVLSFGELLSSTLGANYLQQHSKHCQWIDVREILKTSINSIHKADNDWHHFLSADCDYSYNAELTFRYDSGSHLLVTQGFIASDQNNKTVLLGREGSDTSASYLAAIVAARKIEIWTDVAGVFTTNPRELTNARQLKRLSFDDARRMANFGAKVLHPIALIPAEKNNIEVVVNDISNPDKFGTTINSQASHHSSTPFAVVVRKKVTQINFNFDKKETINTLEAMGYDILLDCSKMKTVNYNHQLFLRFVDTTSAEPDQDTIASILTLKSSHSDKVENIHINYSIGMLTIVGKENGEWVKDVELFSQKQLDIDHQDCFSFQSSGRISIICDKERVLSNLALLHNKFIDNNDSDIFGQCWNQIEN